MRVWEALRATERRCVLRLSYWGDQAGLRLEREMERERREELGMEGFALEGQLGGEVSNAAGGGP